MRYGVLGPLAVWDAAGRPVKVPGVKVRALLANLLVHGGGPVSADRLIDDLWAGRPPAGAANTLHTKVSQLRRALGREQVVREPAGYRLVLPGGAAGAAGTVDAMRFQELATQARTRQEPAVSGALFAEALALWRGPAYADVAGALFARGEITRLEELRLTVLEEQAEVRLSLGEHAALADELGPVVASHPLRERLRAAHMRALYRSGRQPDALRGFHELRRHLADELGVSPGPAVRSLHEAILRQDAHLAPPTGTAPSGRPDRPGSSRPAGPSSPSGQAGPSSPYGQSGPHRTNLPAPLTPLVGRHSALARVRAQLTAPDGARLVTLVGLGGVGKTRLAIAAAHALAERFADGVWWVELAGLGAGSTPDDLAERVITTLGLCDTAATEPDLNDLVGWLGRAVADKHLLVLLDNCEHLVDPVAVLAGALLAAAPRAQALVTSQVAVGIPGEVLHPVPPLALPQDGAHPDPDVLVRSGAVELFVARAAAAVPGFVLDAANARAITTICRRLDGIPLALELVAPRLRTLPPDALADQLRDRFTTPAVRGGRFAPSEVRARGLPARQQTLRAMLDWSWQLLPPAERAVLRRLAVHADGCTLASAQAVCADAELPAEQVPELLAHLVDRSLVTCVAGRFRLLESVAAYGVERLAEAGETAVVRARFVRCYVELAAADDARLRGPNQRRCLDSLDAETVNLRRALELAVAGPASGDAVRLVNSLAWYWFLRGRLTEARRAFRSALAAGGDASSIGSWTARAWLAGVELRTAPAGAPGQPVAGDPTVGLDDPALRARLQWFVGSALTGRGRQRAGHRLVSAALAGARAAGDGWGEAVALVELATRAPAHGALAAELGAALFHEIGDRWGQLRAARALALAAEGAGDRTRAERLHHDGLLMAEELGLWTEVVETLTRLGGLALAGGHPERATDLYGRALAVSTERSYTRGEIRAETGLGHAARLHGDHPTARLHLARALAKTRTLGRAAGGPGEPSRARGAGEVPEVRGTPGG
ncbi:AfsR/SARP family transcriptional regulator [Streptomyces sp. 796.1]|uniref:AfsR/SARP family transcriptional regulator n=1 Tax=Streptomyces sp. 796.1 TaxID=3163029 RepID=UPI0039C9D256